MKPTDEKTERWESFLQSLKPEETLELHDDEKCAMFLQRWRDPQEWTVDRYRLALWQWREQRMKEPWQ